MEKKNERDLEREKNYLLCVKKTMNRMEKIIINL